MDSIENLITSNTTLPAIGLEDKAHKLSLPSLELNNKPAKARIN
jgi:hypothetical protein